MIHELKIQSEYFVAVNNKTKTFEIRKNDRDFKVGDKILLREIDSCGKYTGRMSWWEITYITDYAQQDTFRGYEPSGVAEDIQNSVERLKNAFCAR